MPIYEPDMTYEDMKKALNSFKCARCDSDLVISWSAQKNSYMLSCRKHPEHEGVVHWGRDPELDEIANKVRGRPYPMTTEEAKKETMTKMLARVDQTRFPKDLTKIERQLMAAIALEYGLDPLFGELMIYQGRPYITIDARRRKAQETGNLDGINSRPATKSERIARQIPDGDYLYLAEVWVKGSGHPFEGWGRVQTIEVARAREQAKTHGRQEDALPIVKDPGDIAEKRAEAEALRRAFHIPLPSAEEILTGEFVVLPEQKPPDKSKTPIPTVSTADLSTLEFKDPGEFRAACLKYFNLSPTETDKEIPEYDLTILAQRKKAWQQIAGVYGAKRVEP